jgi:hypothetical protein
MLASLWHDVEAYNNNVLTRGGQTGGFGLDYQALLGMVRAAAIMAGLSKTPAQPAGPVLPGEPDNGPGATYVPMDDYVAKRLERIEAKLWPEERAQVRRQQNGGTSG